MWRPKKISFSPLKRSFTSLGNFVPPLIKNEPFQSYLPGSVERKALKEALKKFRTSKPVDIPCVVNGKEIRSGDEEKQVVCSDHKQVLAIAHRAKTQTIQEAIDGSLKAREYWYRLPFDRRAAVFLKAADLLSTKYRADVCAATMLGQGKTVWQAEIDAAVELIDFWRFAVKYAQEIHSFQPPFNDFGVWNRMEYRPLDGFVAAISPFNFTAIGGNLPSSPAIMGNVAVWKPAPTALLSNYLAFNILREAGLPDGVIQFLPADGPTFGDTVLDSPDFAGLHFTGSTKTFKHLVKKIYQNLDKYKSYPRVVGETGGKDFHFVHSSANVDNVVAQTIRGSFEYQGQKCSATSRAYIPDNLWPEFKTKLINEVKKIKMGQPDDFSTFMTAVIDHTAFKKIVGYIEHAKASKDCEIICGGGYNDKVGYFIEPTVIVTTNPYSKTMVEEIFGPVLTIYVYPSQEFEKTLRICDESTSYGLTGSIFAQDIKAIETANDILRFAAGNFYINDKCTGSIVGQQPFGGSRASGTNDKSGASLNLLRWTSARSIKEQSIPLRVDGWSYPHVVSD